MPTAAAAGTAIAIAAMGLQPLTDCHSSHSTSSLRTPSLLPDLLPARLLLLLQLYNIGAASQRGQLAQAAGARVVTATTRGAQLPGC